MGVSLKPSDAVAGGALIDDVDVVIEKVRFRLWDYNGAIQTPVLGLEVTFKDDDGGETTQVYSAGDTKHFVPSEDGTEAVAVGANQNLNDSTNAMAFMVSVVNAGFPEDKIGDKVSVFEGTRVHVNQVPQPKRKGIQGAKDNKTVLLVTKILGLPWEGKTAAKPKAAAKATGAPKTATAGTVAPAAAPAAGDGETGDLNERAKEVMMGIIMAKGGSIVKSQIAQAAFKELGNDPNRNALVQLVYKDDFLKQPDVPWTFDGTTVTMG